MTRRRGTTRFVPLVACVVAALVSGACSGEDDRADAGTPSTTAATSSSTAAPSTTAPTTTVPADACDPPTAAGARPSGTYAVGRQLRSYVDAARPTQADDSRGVPAEPQRTLPISVLYPSSGTPAEPGVFVEDAPALDGDFPLVVYSHGVMSGGTERNDTLARWASAGYVVVAPTYPRSSGGGGMVADLPHQAEDVVFVVDTFSDEVADPDDALHGVVATGCLALAGHSLGGATTMAASFDPCCQQLGVRAVVDIAGVLIQTTPGATLSDAPPIPTMIVHGVEDPLVGYFQGRRALDELTGPRWLVSLIDGDHNSMFVPPESAALDASTLALLDAELKGDRTGLDALPATLEGLRASGVVDVTLESAGPTG